MDRQANESSVNMYRRTVTGGRHKSEMAVKKHQWGDEILDRQGCSRQRLHYQTIRQGVGKRSQ